MNNQPFMVRPTLVGLNLDELNYYPFIISLDWRDGTCDTAEDLFGRIHVPHRIKDANLNVFNLKKK